MFIGRERELGKLNELYHTDTFQFAAIYGRRRVGKTALINEFIKDKETIYFTAVESNAAQNLENLSRSILSYKDAQLENNVFRSLQHAIEYVFKIAKTKRIVFVIDEYPYIAKVSKSLASTLQLLIDRNKDASKLFLILCGSSMSFMENHVLAYKAPLYGRRTAQFKILPFDYFESRKCLPKAKAEDAAVIYGLVGGTPQYLLHMDDSLTLEENIKRCLLSPTHPLFEEPVNLLKQEVREPAVYNAVIAAIASGCTKLSEISSRVGEETGACSGYINNLISLGIIRKEMPFATNSTRKTIYKVDDNLFRFWHRFIPGNITQINRGLIDDVYNKISAMLSDYMGLVFEDICMAYLWKLREKRLATGDSTRCPVEFADLGRWWGTDPVAKCDVEIDIMGTDGKDSAVFCECKWTNKKTDTGVLSALMEKSGHFTYANKFYYIFAKAGFTEGCIKMASEHKQSVIPLTFDEIAEEN